MKIIFKSFFLHKKLRKYLGILRYKFFCYIFKIKPYNQFFKKINFEEVKEEIYYLELTKVFLIKKSNQSSNKATKIIIEKCNKYIDYEINAEERKYFIKKLVSYTGGFNNNEDCFYFLEKMIEKYLYSTEILDYVLKLICSYWEQRNKLDIAKRTIENYMNILSFNRKKYFQEKLIGYENGYILKKDVLYCKYMFMYGLQYTMKNVSDIILRKFGKFFVEYKFVDGSLFFYYDTPDPKEISKLETISLDEKRKIVKYNNFQRIYICDMKVI